MLQAMGSSVWRYGHVGRSEATGGACALLATSGGPWAFTDPRRDGAMFPFTDEESASVVDEAVASLVLLRAPMWLGDCGARVSVLVSVAAQAGELLFDAVAAARDQGYTWDQIAGRLGATASTARRRYGGHTAWSPSRSVDGD